VFSFRDGRQGLASVGGGEVGGFEICNLRLEICKAEGPAEKQLP